MQLCSYTPDAIGIEKLAGHDGHPLVDPRYAKAILDCANGSRNMGAMRIVIKDRHLAAIDEAAPQDIINAACRQRSAVWSQLQKLLGSRIKRTGTEIVAGRPHPFSSMALACASHLAPRSAAGIHVCAANSQSTRASGLQGRQGPVTACIMLFYTETTLTSQAVLTQ